MGIAAPKNFKRRITSAAQKKKSSGLPHSFHKTSPGLIVAASRPAYAPGRLPGFAETRRIPESKRAACVQTARNRMFFRFYRDDGLFSADDARMRRASEHQIDRQAEILNRKALGIGIAQLLAQRAHIVQIQHNGFAFGKRIAHFK